MQSLADAVTPYLIDALTTLIGLAVAWAATQFASTQAAVKAKTGLDIEAVLRGAVHQALETGVKSAVSDTPNAAASAIINLAVQHAMQSVPDAISGLGAPLDVLARIAAAKLHDLEAAGAST